MYRASLSFLLFLLSFSSGVYACTIVSAVDADGQVWNMNNEDGPLGVANFMRVFPRTDTTRYGFYSLAYLSPDMAAGGSIQGGMNEAGLTFDFNAMRNVAFAMGDRKSFPAGNRGILPHILGNFTTVEEVVEFFNTYWFENGFTSAQMHVADRSGTFAIISASGVMVSEEGKPLVSTNFDICGKEDGSTCWRYPLAVQLLEENEIGLETMQRIASETSVDGQGHTLYTNIQNLTTGDIWFTSRHSSEQTVRINIKELLARGARTYVFSNLEAVVTGQLQPVREEAYAPVAVNVAKGQSHTGTYHNDFIGNIAVTTDQEGLALTLENGIRLVLRPYAPDKYYLPGDSFTVEFVKSDDDDVEMAIYQEGYWSATANKN